MLIAAAAFVYVQLRADLDESIDATLQARATAVATGGVAAGIAGDDEDGFAQVQSPDGRVVDSAGGTRGAVAPRSGERQVPGIDGTARILMRRDHAAAGGGAIVVVGQSLEDRDEVLAGLIAAFAIGGPLAVLVASLLGYALAGAGLRPVETMRRRAAAGDRQLPLPAAHERSAGSARR